MCACVCVCGCGWVVSGCVWVYQPDSHLHTVTGGAFSDEQSPVRAVQAGGSAGEEWGPDEGGAADHEADV